MARNYLKGFKGDEINLLLAASAFNLKKLHTLTSLGHSAEINSDT
jgi:hypothetical protein